MSRLVGIVVTLLAVALPAPAAADLRARDMGQVPSGVVSADDRYLASSDRTTGLVAMSGPVTVRDLATGGSRSVPTPPGCAFTDVGAGTLLWTCAGRGYADNGLVYDLRTGEWRAYTPVAPRFGVGETARFVAVGRRWIHVERHGSDRSRQDEFIDRKTGDSRFAAEAMGDRKRHADLDAARLVRRLCGGVARPLVPVRDGGGPALGPGPLALAGRSAAATMFRDRRGVVSARVGLRRCQRPMRTLSHCRDVACSQPQLDDRRVAWTETTRTTPARTRVRVHDISRERTTSIDLPETARASGVWLVRGRVFATNGERLFRIVDAR